MNIVAHNHQSRELLSSKISHFLEEFHVGRILKSCNAYKVRGFSVKSVFQVAFENAFSNKSFFQKQREYSNCIPFAKDTFYRFMNSSSINWRKFTLQLASAVIGKIEPLTHEKRRGRSPYLLSVEAEVVKGKQAIPVKLVFVRNRNKRQDYLILVSTDVNLSEEELIQTYGKRWNMDALIMVLKKLVSMITEKWLFIEKELIAMLDSFLENLPDLWQSCLKRCA